MTNNEQINEKSARLSDWTNKIGIAKHIGCSVRHITNQQRRRRIPFYRVGRCVKFRVSEVENALKAYRCQAVGSFESRGQ